MSGAPSGTTGTPDVVPRLIAALLDVSLKSLLDLLMKPGFVRSLLLEYVAPGIPDELFTKVSERLERTEMFDPDRDQA